jgi:hypothetical protein
MPARETNQTREAILKVAVEQFAQSGYAGASVQNIISAAGITKPIALTGMDPPVLTKVDPSSDVDRGG